MLNVTGNTYEMTWDPASRVATLRFSADTHGTGKDAVALIDALTAWIADDPRPFALLGDGGRLKGVDAEYRSRWNRFLRQHRDRCFIAFFNMSALLRIAADMFRIGSGLRLKAFADEESARAWLRRVGIAA
jgi:hypothetical protein